MVTYKPKLTKFVSSIDQCKLTEGKSKDEFSVDGIKGLKVLVSRQSTTFMHRFSFNGKKTALTLGKYPLMTMSDAIQIVKQQHLYIEQGINPAGAKQKKAAMPTFAQFAQTYLKEMKPHKRSWGDDESRLRVHLIPTLGNMPMDEINSKTLSELINAKQEGGLGKATVNRIRTLLSVLFNMAIEHDIVETNPVTRVRKFKENNQIERFLSDNELSSVMLVLNNPSKYSIKNLVIVAIVKFLLLTGLRKREAMDMKFEDVDFDKGLLHIKLNKAGKARYVPLNLDALSIIQKMAKTGIYVFANPNTGLPYADIRKTFDAIMSHADVSNMRIHDLRHNFASMAVNSGETLFVVQKLLGHASIQTTERYAHIKQSTLSDATERVSSLVRRASENSLAS